VDFGIALEHSATGGYWTFDLGFPENRVKRKKSRLTNEQVIPNLIKLGYNISFENKK
jgi:hypothetical protein